MWRLYAVLFLYYLRWAWHYGGLRLPVISHAFMPIGGLVKDPKKTDSLYTELPERGRICSPVKFVAQRLVGYMGEAGLFYVRKLGEKEGFIFGITIKCFLEVEGGGSHHSRAVDRKTLACGTVQWIYKKRHASRLNEVFKVGESYRINFAGSHSRGTIFRDGTYYKTEALRVARDKIADGISNVHFGRFDFCFRDFQEFLLGKTLDCLRLMVLGASNQRMG